MLLANTFSSDMFHGQRFAVDFIINRQRVYGNKKGKASQIDTLITTFILNVFITGDDLYYIAAYSIFAGVISGTLMLVGVTTRYFFCKTYQFPIIRFF